MGWGSLDDDLDWEIMDRFWQEISAVGYESNSGVIKLKPHNDPTALSNALRILISSERVRINVRGLRTVDDAVISKLVDSAYGKFHGQVFNLLNEYRFLGIRGKGGYGLTLPVEGIHRVVSICTVHLEHPEFLQIGRKPSSSVDRGCVARRSITR